MRGRGDIVEILEVFDVGTSGAALPIVQPATEPPRRRRLWPALAGLALTAILVAAMAWPASGQKSATPATTVPRPAPRTTTATTGTLTGFRMIASAPPGYHPSYATDLPAGMLREGVTEVWRPLFANFGEHGTWTMIQARRQPFSYAQGDHRVQIGNGVGILGDDLGVRSLTFPTDDGWTIQMWARVDDDEWLVGNAAFVSVRDGTIDFPGGDGIHQPAYNLRVDDNGGSLFAVSGPLTQMGFTDDRGEEIWVFTSERPGPARQALDEFLLYREVRLADGTSARFAEGLLADSTVLRFERNDSLVTVIAPTVDAAIRAADSVRPATGFEWRDLQRQAAAAPSRDTLGAGSLLGSGDLDSGRSWTAVGMVDSGRQRLYLRFGLGPSSDSSGTPHPGDEASQEIGVDQRYPAAAVIIPRAVTSATYLTALLAPSWPARGAVLRIWIDGQAAPVDVPLAEPTDRFPFAAASYAFSQLATWTAQIVMPDGSVVALAS